jgi:hypothetical protein
MGWILRFTVSVGVLISLACGNSGGDRAPRGQICARNSDPLPVDTNPRNEAGKPQKLAMDNSANGIAQYPGKYTYDGADLFYRNTKTGAQMQFTEGLDRRKQNMVLSPVCVSG